MPVDQTAAILKAYLGKNVLLTRQQFGVHPNANPREFEAIADRHPAFRIVRVDNSPRERRAGQA